MSRGAGPVRLLWAAGGLWLFAAVLFIGAAVTDARRASFAGKYIGLVCEDGGIGAAEAESIRALEQEKEDGIEFTAWSERKRVQIQSMDGCRSAAANVIEISGSSELLFPGGRILHTEDTDGCLIGEETARQLFGSSRAEGEIICYQGSWLTVRGVIASFGPLLVVEAREPDVRFDRITLKPQSGIARRTCAERFTGAYGLTASQVRYDLFSGERLRELIPGKWSDFAGWKQSLSLFCEDASLLLAVEKSSMEERYLLLYARSAGWMTAGLFCLSAVRRPRASAPGCLSAPRTGAGETE